MTIYQRILFTLPLFAVGCDSAPEPETPRSQTCYEVCYVDDPVDTVVVVPDPTGDETSSNPPPNDPCCIVRAEQDRCMPGGDLGVQECVGAILFSCVGPDPEDQPWDWKCVTIAMEQCGLVCN